ncbi:alpha/beta fold hydrolase [Aestuariimicrobium sp. Y1814]|uniref:alpha/beta fold hydrolase n=1 Tax=Aestuariimicrobium sp. Y1814 TaxID=3418742 RepID=UPI003DA78A07
MRSTVFHLEVNGQGMGIHHWIPDTDPRGIVQISHGMAEHGGRYDGLARALTEQGWVVIAGDHRGHGRTAAAAAPATQAAADPLGNLGHFADKLGWSKVVEDLRAVALHAAVLHPGLPTVLLGHSMGSLLARDYASQWAHDLDGLVLSGTPRPQGLIGSAAKQFAKAQVRARGPRSRANRLDRMNFGAYNNQFKPARTDFDWLSRDEAEVDAYIADPACGFVCTSALYVDLIGGLERVNSKKVVKNTGKKLPVLLQTGSLDPVGGERAATALKGLYRSIGNKHVTLKTYSGARHEVYHETNRAEVFADLLTWLDALGGRRKK